MSSSGQPPKPPLPSASREGLASSSRDGSNSNSRQDLRDAGRDYFNQMVSKTSEGSLALKPPRRKREKVDKDVAAFGQVIEGGKMYFALSVCQVCRALGVFLLKVCMSY